MAMSDFFEKFPKLAATELRNITILSGTSSPLPPDCYGFLELFCDERDCDCRRVMISVFAEKQRRFMAHINLGFDSDGPMPGPFLDLINPQTQYASELLNTFTDMINYDPAYLHRLQRHYVMFKEKIEGRRYQGAPFETPGEVKRVIASSKFTEQLTTSLAMAQSSTATNPVTWRRRKIGRNEPCPCGSGKKYKKCCMVKPKDEKSKPAATSDNASMTTVPEENNAQMSTAEEYLDKAEELIRDLVKWQQRGEIGNRWDTATQRELEDTPEIATSLLRLLLTRYAPSGPDDEVGREYHACMELLEEALTQLRYSVDRKRPWAIKMAEQIQIEIAEQAFRREVDVKLQHDLIFVIHDAKLQLHPRIRERQAELAEYYGRFSAGKEVPDLDKLFAKIAEETASNTPFDMLDPILAEINLMPLDGQLLMAAGMMTTPQTLFNELAVLLLLHPNPEVRSQLPDIFLQVGGVKNITPLGLRRMVGLRNWLPQKERPAVDRLIRSARLANIASAPLPSAQAVTVHASPFDGAGTQGSWMTYRVKRDNHVMGVLVKQGKGIHEAWQQSGFTHRDIDAMARDMHRSGGSEQVQTAFLRRLVPHFIAVGLRNNAPPPAQLLSVDEVLGNDYWKPQWVSPTEEIERLVATEPRSFTPDKVKQALKISQKWPEQLDIASSWFEDDVRVDELLRQRAGSASRWLNRIELASGVIMKEILEDKRDIWSERLLWMALWAQASQARKPQPWQEFLILARELQHSTPLEQIPLMAAIATRSVQSAWRRAQLR
jgi:SEC-C motif